MGGAHPHRVQERRVMEFDSTIFLLCRRLGPRWVLPLVRERTQRHYIGYNRVGVYLQKKPPHRLLHTTVCFVRLPRRLTFLNAWLDGGYTFLRQSSEASGRLSISDYVKVGSNFAGPGNHLCNAVTLSTKIAAKRFA